MIRGRLAVRGVRRITLAEFCDIVWAEIWDDCSPMGDQSQYREIVHKLFIEGLEPWQITYVTTDKKGRKVTKRLGSGGERGSAPSKQMLAEGMALHRRLQQMKAEMASQGGLASEPDAQPRRR